MTDTLMTTSAVVVNEVQVLVNGIVVDYITNVLPGGYITTDTTAENMRTLTMGCLDLDGTLSPVLGGELYPDGVELAVSVGFMIDDEPVLWQQGIFGVQECDSTTAAADTDSGSSGSFPGPGPNLAITAVDRSNRVAVNLFEDAFVIPSGTTVGEAIEMILEAQAPWCVNPNITPTEATVAQQVFSPGDDPWQQIVTIAASDGMVAYFDETGTLVVRPTPTLNGDSVAFSLVDGPEQMALSVSPIYSNSPGYNGVIVTNTSSVTNADGSTTEVQIAGTAFDLDPTSKTYALGPYGKRPAPPVQVTTCTSDAMAENMAQSLLPQVLGMSNSVVVDNLTIPQAKPYALAYIDNGATGYSGTVALQQSTLYLDHSNASSMTFVPLGSPITSLAYLKGPSQAEFGSVNPYFAGAGSVGYSGSGYTYSTYSSSSGSSASPGRALTSGFRLMYVGDRLIRVFSNGPHGSGVDGSDEEDVVDEGIDGLEDL